MIILDKKAGLNRVFSRTQEMTDNIQISVKEMLQDIRLNGDKALFEYTKKFDKVSVSEKNILVTKNEIEDAYSKVSKSLISALRNAKNNIEAYHKKQVLKGELTNISSGKTGFMIRPVSRAGIYVPGGKASYPSSVLMTAVPATVAGVKDIIMCTPSTSTLTIVPAVECGVSKIFRVGGAQAVGAMAYGTQSISKVHVVCGPGHLYVTEAKLQVYGTGGIDMLA